MITTRTLPNGLRCALETMPTTTSVAVHLLVPPGSAHDDDSTSGCASMLLESLFRGTQSRLARDLGDAMDAEGMQRHRTLSTRFMHLQFVTTTDHFDASLKLLMDVITSPALLETDVEPVRERCLQSLERVADEPHEEVLIEARKLSRTRPWHHSGLGSHEGLHATDAATLRAMHARCCVPQGSVLAVAGAVEVDRVMSGIESATAPWAGKIPDLEAVEPGPGGHLVLERQTAQAHLVMTWPAPPIGDEAELLERFASAILGGTTSGRLFTQVRQRRSLCYSVQSHYGASKHEGWCTLSAGTLPDQAAQLIDACRGEVHRMGRGVTAEEFARARKAMRTSLILRDESTSARASRLGGALVDRGHCLTQQQHLDRIEGVSLEQVNAWCERYADIEPSLVVAAPAGTDLGDSVVPGHQSG